MNTVPTKKGSSKFHPNEEDMYINDSLMEDDEDFGDEWDDMQDSVTFDKQRIKIDNSIKKSGDRIK